MQVSESITQRSASNLALAFFLLPKEKKQAMSALYAFCREVDDVADEESKPVEARREELARWRRDIKAACGGREAEIAVIRELKPFIAQYGLRLELFEELIRGVEMDLSIRRYADYEELELYCHRVASVVGLLSIEIFEYRNPRCHEYAMHLGKALQLTNILRDVRNDAERGRIYLPLSELARFRVTEEELLSFQYSERFEALAASVAERARDHYRKAAELLPDEDRQSMATAELMGEVYRKLLDKLKAKRFNVLGPEPTRLSKLEKAFLIFRTWVRNRTGG